MSKNWVKYIFKGSALFILVGLCIGSGYAEGVTDIGGVAQTVTSNVENLAKLITAAAYVAGMGFAVGAILKFKAHRDNPTQIPVGTPIAMIFIAAALIFLPNIFAVSGGTLFGSTTEIAGPSGVAWTGIQNN